MLASPEHPELDALPALQQHEVRVAGESGMPPSGELRTDILAAEVPVALVFNGLSHAVMMATPQDLVAFAMGFALSEGIIDDASQSRGIEVRIVSGQVAGWPASLAMLDAVEVHMDISTGSFERLKRQRRQLAGRTGCGVCGIESLAALDLQCSPVRARPWVDQVSLPAVLAAMAALPGHQILHAQSGAVHAAGWSTLTGRLTDVMEDVGRHNALDKLLGLLAAKERLAEPGFVVMSSRASHELVRKCAKVGVAALATVSAPTSMGIRMAEVTGLRLWGLCRAPRGVLYAPGLH
jgi:FdhD protein